MCQLFTFMWEYFPISFIFNWVVVSTTIKLKFVFLTLSSIWWWKVNQPIAQWFGLMDADLLCNSFRIWAPRFQGSHMAAVFVHQDFPKGGGEPELIAGALDLSWHWKRWGSLRTLLWRHRECQQFHREYDLCHSRCFHSGEPGTFHQDLETDAVSCDNASETYRLSNSWQMVVLAVACALMAFF